MNQQPEKLFRDKLEAHTKPAPAMAWTKIEKNLDKKNNGPFWLKIAASFLLVATASVWLWKSGDKETPAVQTAQQNGTKQEAPVNVEKPADASIPAITEQQTQHAPAEPAKRSIASAPKRKTIPVVEEEIKLPTIAAAEVEKEIAVEEKLTEATPVSPAETIATNTPAPATSGVTLIYTAEEVNDKYLDKKSLAEATSEGKKSSTLRKLLDKAYDLKNNQDPFGDLRQKKNEILALNFKNEKQRSQNK